MRHETKMRIIRAWRADKRSVHCAYKHDEVLGYKWHTFLHLSITTFKNTHAIKWFINGVEVEDD